MATWYNAAWPYRQKVSILRANIGSTLTNFVLFLNEEGFSKAGNPNDVFERARFDGKDIIITAEDGTTKLNSELVYYHQIDRKLELYVNMPIVSTISDTNIYVYYGNSSHIELPNLNTWSDYQYVSHNGGLSDVLTDTAATLYGSATSSTANSPTYSSSIATGEGDVIDTNISLFTYPLTFQAIVKTSINTPGAVLGTFNDTNGDFYIGRSSGQWYATVEGNGGTLAFDAFNLNEWDYLSVSLSNNYFATYQNGELKNQSYVLGQNSINTGASLKLNDVGDFNSSFGGLMFDEIRVSTRLLTEDYLYAEYLNFTSPLTFYSVTTEQLAAGAYVDPPTTLLLTETTAGGISIGANVLPDGDTSTYLTGSLGNLGTGKNLLMTSGSMQLVAYHFSVQANSEVFGTHFNFNPGQTYAGASQFKPIKRFELFNEQEGNKNKDSEFISKIIEENINTGGVVCYVWLLEGTFDQHSNGVLKTQLDEAHGEPQDGLLGLFGIQDSILGENRDRAYAKDAIRLKGTYAVSQNELDFARYGIMLNNDIIQVEIHKGEMERLCGRRLIPGDVVEMPHLRESGIDGSVVNRFYQVESITRSPTSFDHTYNYHVLAVTMRPAMDAHEFIDLMERKDEYGKTIKEQLGNSNLQNAVTETVRESASEQAYTTGWDLTPLYVDDEDNVFSHRYSGDGIPPNGKPVDMLTYFPSSPSEGQYVCRVDHFPNRLYRFQNNRWLLKEIDRKRDWQPYNWTSKLREFSTNRSLEDDMRPWEYKSIHDVLTPRQGRSEPSPKGHDIKHIELFDWERQIPIDIPPEVVAPPIIRSATLVPTVTPLVISDHLNANTGQFNFFLFFYVLKQGTNQTTGEILINDDGNNVSMDHEWTTIGTNNVTFTVVNEGGLRKLKYSLSGSDNVSMQYFVKAKW